MIPNIGAEVGKLLVVLFIALMIFLPLGLWKAAEIIWWVFQ
jgi:hypothetical protein